MPRRTIECDDLLERKGLLNPDRIGYVALDLIQLEHDLLSLELPDNFAHFMLRDDDTYKVYVMNSVNRIESVFGQIKYKYGLGQVSTELVRKLTDQAA